MIITIISFSLIIIVGSFIIQTTFGHPITLGVVNGNEVIPHSLPYMAFIQTIINNRKIRCGGSLINTHQILTAASCVYTAQNVSIILGAHDISVEEETQLKLESSNFTIHKDYDPNTLINDIALINLNEKVELNDFISTIPTPPLKDILLTFADDLGEVAGWGKFSDKNSSYSNVLREIKATIIPYLSCTISYLFKIKMSQICTTGLQNSENICLGDSGSPLVVNGTQVGIASFGSDFGCEFGAPGVYTRLTSYYFWLLENKN